MFECSVKERPFSVHRKTNVVECCTSMVFIKDQDVLLSLRRCIVGQSPGPCSIMWRGADRRPAAHSTYNVKEVPSGTVYHQQAQNNEGKTDQNI